MTFSRFFAAALISLVAWQGSAHAQQQAPAQAQATPVRMKVAIINMEAVRRNAAVMKDIRAQVSAHRSAFQKDVQKEEDALRTANEELRRQRTILAPETFAEERRKFEERLVEVQRGVQTRRQALDRAQNDALAEVQNVLGKVIADIATENGLTLILREDQTVLAAKQLNITAHVLQELDKRLATYKLPEPTVTDQGAK